MQIFRALVLQTALVLVATCPSLGLAQAYPDKPVRIVVPFPAGGTADILTRMLGQKLTESLGYQMVVDNRPGAGGSVASDLVARAPADGYTLLMGYVGTHAINPTLYAKLPYDAVKDFSPVSLVATSPNILVVPASLKVRTVQDLVALAKAKPGEITYSSAGNGTAPHLAGALFAEMAGIRMVHVPYKGAPQATTDLIAGRTDMQFPSIPVVMPFVKSGKLRAVAVTSAKRSPALPDLPTIAETVPGYEVISWYGILGPAGLPSSIIEKLHSEIGKALRQPDLIEFYSTQGAEAAASTPEGFAELIRTDISKWAKIVRVSGARID